MDKTHVLKFQYLGLSCNRWTSSWGTSESSAKKSLKTSILLNFCGKINEKKKKKRLNFQKEGQWRISHTLSQPVSDLHALKCTCHILGHRWFRHCARSGKILPPLFSGYLMSFQWTWRVEKAPQNSVSSAKFSLLCFSCMESPYSNNKKA